MSDLYHVSSSPHVRSKDTTERIMLYVIIALLPTSLFGIYNFGYKALILILVTIACCVASEWIFNKIVHKKQTINDLSAVVTGLLSGIKPSGNTSMVGSCNRRCICNRGCKMYVRRIGTELHEPCSGCKMFPSDCICS